MQRSDFTKPKTKHNELIPRTGYPQKEPDLKSYLQKPLMLKIAPKIAKK